MKASIAKAHGAILPPMFWWTRAQTLGWLSSNGVHPLSDGLWSVPGSPEPSTTNDVAHEWTDRALNAPALSPDERLMLGFGLLDLLDDYAVAIYLALHFENESKAAATIDLVWQFCREVLERPEGSETVTLWLWTDWFLDTEMAGMAFDAVTEGWGQSETPKPTMRRLDRVLRWSGTAEWPRKAALYRWAARRSELQPALLEGLTSAFNDGFGEIDPAQAVELLDELARVPEMHGSAATLAQSIRAR